MKASLENNWKHYLQEALGLAIFMFSACFFSAMFEGDTSWHNVVPNAFVRLVIIGVLMGATALFIFYSPFTSPSGSQINPAVTITFLRLGKIKKWDALFYIIFQMIGGTVAVYIIAHFIKEPLTALPVNYAATIPFGGVVQAFFAEFITAFVMMTMILTTSSHQQLKKYTRIIAACFVCLFVIIAGPISGFGMNPARSLASAIPSNTWTAFWIYALVPIISMLLAAEVYIRMEKRKMLLKYRKALELYLQTERFKIFNDSV